MTTEDPRKTFFRTVQADPLVIEPADEALAWARPDLMADALVLDHAWPPRISLSFDGAVYVFRTDIERICWAQGYAAARRAGYGRDPEMPENGTVTFERRGSTSHPEVETFQAWTRAFAASAKPSAGMEALHRALNHAWDVGDRSRNTLRAIVTGYAAYEHASGCPSPKAPGVHEPVRLGEYSEYRALTKVGPESGPWRDVLQHQATELVLAAVGLWQAGLRDSHLPDYLTRGWSAAEKDMAPQQDAGSDAEGQALRDAGFEWNERTAQWERGPVYIVRQDGAWGLSLPHRSLLPRDTVEEAIDAARPFVNWGEAVPKTPENETGQAPDGQNGAEAQKQPFPEGGRERATGPTAATPHDRPVNSGGVSKHGKTVEGWGAVENARNEMTHMPRGVKQAKRWAAFAEEQMNLSSDNAPTAIALSLASLGVDMAFAAHPPAARAAHARLMRLKGYSVDEEASLWAYRVVNDGR